MTTETSHPAPSGAPTVIDLADGAVVDISGTLLALEKRSTEAGSDWASGVLAHILGDIQVLFDPEQYNTYRDELERVLGTPRQRELCIPGDTPRVRLTARLLAWVSPDERRPGNTSQLVVQTMEVLG